TPSSSDDRHASPATTSPGSTPAQAIPGPASPAAASTSQCASPCPTFSEPETAGFTCCAWRTARPRALAREGGAAKAAHTRGAHGGVPVAAAARRGRAVDDRPAEEPALPVRAAGVHAAARIVERGAFRDELATGIEDGETGLDRYHQADAGPRPQGGDHAADV